MHIKQHFLPFTYFKIEIITIKSQEPKYCGKPRTASNHRLYQICDLTIFRRILILDINDKCLLASKYSIFIRNKKGFRVESIQSRVSLPTWLMCILYSILRYSYLTKIPILYCTKVAQNYNYLTREALFSKICFWHIYILCEFVFANRDLYKFCEIHFDEDTSNF